MSGQEISNLERGRSFPQERTRHRIEAVLNTEINWFSTLYQHSKINRQEIFAMISKYVGGNLEKAKLLHEHINNVIAVHKPELDFQKHSIKK